VKIPRPEPLRPGADVSFLCPEPLRPGADVSYPCYLNFERLFVPYTTPPAGNCQAVFSGYFP